MELVLDVYEEPYEPRRPYVCFDERPCQVLDHVRDPLSMRPGRPAVEDYEYEREGTCCVLMAFEPLRGTATRLAQGVGARSASEGRFCTVHP